MSLHCVAHGTAPSHTRMHRENERFLPGTPIRLPYPLSPDLPTVFSQWVKDGWMEATGTDVVV